MDYYLDGSKMPMARNMMMVTPRKTMMMVEAPRVMAVDTVFWAARRGEGRNWKQL